MSENASEKNEKTVNWFDAMTAGLAADGLLHPKGRFFVDPATGARTWLHPLEPLDTKANGLVTTIVTVAANRPPTAVDEGEPPPPPRPKKRAPAAGPKTATPTTPTTTP